MANYRQQVAKQPFERGQLAKSSAALVLLLAFVAAGAVYSSYILFPEAETGASVQESFSSTPSRWAFYKSAAVASDVGRCSNIGTSFLRRNGSAVDAAIATLLCNSVLTMHSSGVGGGLFMVIWENSTKRSYVIDGQSVVPLVFAGKKVISQNADLLRLGPVSVAVPGSVAAMWTAHQKFGRLPWRDLFQPSIELCEYGFQVSEVLLEGINYFKTFAVNSSDFQHLRDFLTNPNTGEFYKEGDVLYCKLLATTYRQLGELNGTDFYKGELAKSIAKDFADFGIQITTQDLENYEPRLSDKAVKVNLPDGKRYLTSSDPSGGPAVALALDILSGFDIRKKDAQNPNLFLLFIETLKYAYCKFVSPNSQTFLGSDYLSQIRIAIANFSHANSSKFTCSNENSLLEDKRGSTTHVSVVDTEGNAVAVTSSISSYFGSLLMGKRTGIVFNNAMSNFAAHGKLVGPIKLQPGQRVFSTMAPAIVIDRNLEPALVVGASGGVRIISAVAYVAMRVLWFGEQANIAIDKARLHNHFASKELWYENGVTDWLQEWFKLNGYDQQQLTPLDWRGRSFVQAIQRLEDGTLVAVSDFRKRGGYPDGF